MARRSWGALMSPKHAVEEKFCHLIGNQAYLKAFHPCRKISVRKYRLRVVLYLNINKTKSLRLLRISITHHLFTVVACALRTVLLCRNRKEGDNVTGIYLVVVGHTLWYHPSTLAFWYHWLIPGMRGCFLASRGFD
jgi:hypothetical protein